MARKVYLINLENDDGEVQMIGVRSTLSTALKTIGDAMGCEEEDVTDETREFHIEIKEYNVGGNVALATYDGHGSLKAPTP